MFLSNEYLAKNIFSTVLEPRYLSQYSDKAMGWMNGVRISAGVGNYSLRHSVHTGSIAQRASYPKGTGKSFPGSKAAGA